MVTLSSVHPMYSSNPLDLPARYNGVVYSVDTHWHMDNELIGNFTIPGRNDYMYALEYAMRVIRRESGCTVEWIWKGFDTHTEVYVWSPLRDFDSVYPYCMEAFSNFKSRLSPKCKI